MSDATSNTTPDVTGATVILPVASSNAPPPVALPPGPNAYAPLIAAYVPKSNDSLTKIAQSAEMEKTRGVVASMLGSADKLTVRLAHGLPCITP